MTRRKILGLLAWTAIATAALVGATAASAAKFTAGKTGATGLEEPLKSYVGTITGSSTSCTSYNLLGKTEGTETEFVKGNVEVSGCSFAGMPATVTGSSCEFAVYANGEGKMTGEGCEVIGIASSLFGKCKSITKPQTLTNAASFSNGGASDIVVESHHSGVVVEVTESTGICPLTVGKHTNASFTGESTVEAEGTTLAWDK